MALVSQRSESGVRVRGRQDGRQRVRVVVLLRLRLAEVDVGIGAVHLYELVPHRGVAVVLVAREPGSIRRAAMVALVALLPAALSRVDSNDFLVFLEGDVAGKPGQRLKTENHKIGFV